MRANYHTHTWRCNHAARDENAYAAQAVEVGLELLGFSDHAPYPYPGGYQSYFHMLPEQAADYFTVVEELARKYQGKLTIAAGVEAEYYPACFSDLTALLADFPCQYMILGQHYIYNEYDGVYAGSPTEDRRVMEQYVRQILMGLDTGRFLYIAHPDLMRFCGPWADYEQVMGLLCREAASRSIPLELNLLGLSEGRHYPNRRFWELAAQHGCQVVLGCDAHSPEGLCTQEAEAKALALCRSLGLEVLETLPLPAMERKDS